MELSKPLVINTAKVRRFVVDEKYSSRMLLDDLTVGTKTVQINEGTVAPLAALDGATHQDNEIYYILAGEGKLNLNGELHEIGRGHLIFIPAGTFHALINTSKTETLVLLTFWREPAENDVYQKRLEQWGTSFVLEEDAE